jgi:hypothetical protein
MQKTKFKIDDFFEYRGTIYRVTGIEFGSYGHIYNVKFMSGDEEGRKSAIGSAGEESMIPVSFSRIPLHTPDNKRDKELKDLINLVLKYHAENLASSFHTESEEEYIFKKIKEQWGQKSE